MFTKILSTLRNRFRHPEPVYPEYKTFLQKTKENQQRMAEDALLYHDSQLALRERIDQFYSETEPM